MYGSHGAEKQLLLQVAEGNELAFSQIYDRYKSSFYITAFKMTRSDAIAQDIVQEVFIALWKKRTYLSASPNPVGYLMTMLHNAIYYHFRKLNREQELKLALVAEDNSLGINPVEEILLAKEHQEMLHKIIKSLPPQQQLIYTLSRQEGLSRTEIAEKLHISPNTVKAHLSAALHTIKTQINSGASLLIWAAISQNV